MNVITDLWRRKLNKLWNLCGPWKDKPTQHRFRHTFGSDMIRAGVSLPALQRLMGHANIQTTLLYIQISPQDVYEEYARAVAKRVAPARIAQP